MIKKIINAFVIYILVLAVAFGILLINQNKYIKYRQYNVSLLAQATAQQLERSIDSCLSLTDYMSLMVDVNEERAINDFEFIASELYKLYPEINCIQLAPGGDIKYIYPVKEKAKFNLFEDKLTKSETIHSRDTGETSIIGPTELRQGGIGLICRKPIYKEDVEDKKIFWGFAAVVIELSDYLYTSDLFEDLGENYNFEISKNDGNDRIVIFKSKENLIEEPVKAGIRLSNGDKWDLLMTPKGNWVDLMRRIYGILAITSSSAVIVFIILRIKSLTRSNKSLKKEAQIDELTNIFNVRAFNEAGHILDKKKDEIYGILIFDINKFKLINDTHGHYSGDLVLKTIALRLNQFMRTEDRIFRVGGDEFAAIIKSESCENFYENLITRLKENVRTELELHDKTVLYPSISIGYGIYPKDGKDFNSIKKIADQRMYEDKKSFYSNDI